MSIKDNLEKIRSEIPSHVTLVAVSKTKPAQMIREAYAAGQRDFGENYVQELEEKHKELPADIRWHAIGHLQSNKVKYIAPFVHLIHGVDSFKLLQEINKQAIKTDRVIDCLLQMHIAKEETKFGFDFTECETLLSSDALKSLQNICIVGFMGMATNTENINEVRAEFRNLKTFFDKAAKLQTSNYQPTTLSMGMSSDYRVAIEEGSTMIRVGSSIFGERNYTK
jgi:pyridoxal phosphate enzyme (YggS family)